MLSEKSDDNWPVQQQNIHTGLELRIQQLFYYLGGGQQRRLSDCAGTQADLRLSWSHLAKAGFVITI